MQGNRLAYHPRLRAQSRRELAHASVASWVFCMDFEASLSETFQTSCRRYCKHAQPNFERWPRSGRATGSSSAALPRWAPPRAAAADPAPEGPGGSAAGSWAWRATCIEMRSTCGQHAGRGVAPSGWEAGLLCRGLQLPRAPRLECSRVQACHWQSAAYACIPPLACSLCPAIPAAPSS